MFTKKEKDVLLTHWKKALPGGATIPEIEANIAIIKSITAKLEALPVEEPVDVEPAVSPELIRAVEGKTRKRH